MRHTRKGFSLIELMLVCTIVGILTLMSMPRVHAMREAYGVRSARTELASAVATARSAAVQKGRVARLRVGDNTFSAVVRTSAAESLFVSEPGDSVLTFGPRGFRTTPRVARTQRFMLRRGASVDSLCVGMLGQILPRGCRP